MENDKFIEISKKKAIIKQLQNEVDEVEKELRKTFSSDVKSFFLLKGFEFKHAEDKYRNLDYENIFINLRQIDEKSTFRKNYEPSYYIAGKNNLIVRFEWYLNKNSSSSQIYWYPEKQSLEDFYNRRLKKTLILPIKVERKNKLNKIINQEEL